MTMPYELPKSWTWHGDKPWPRWWNLHGWYVLAMLYIYS